MNALKNIVIVSAVFITVNIFSQKVDNISTDRPDQTETPDLLPDEFSQLELGFDYESRKHSFINNTNNEVIIKNEFYSLPSVLLRYGILNNMELRFGIDFSFSRKTDQIKYADSTYEFEKKSSGLSGYRFGTKIFIMDEKGPAPKTSLLLSINIPTNSNSSFQSKYISTEFRFAMSHTLSRRFSLSYNLGAEWNGDDANPTGLYTLSLGIGLIKNLSMFAESFGYVKKNSEPDFLIDGGFTYQPAKNFQFDFSGGTGLTENLPDFFLSAGFSVRLPQ